MDNKLITSIMLIFAVVILVATVLIPSIDSFGSSETVTTNVLQNIDGTNLFDEEDISIAVTTSDTTWVVTTDGKLFGYGKNTYGQQGDGTTTNVTEFTQRLGTETIANVVCTSTSTWAITTDGKLFGCGWNSSGQQGDGTTTNVTEFTQRLGTETIASVYPAGSVTWALTTDGKLFGCGRNNYGQQGDGTTTDVTEFTQRLGTETIVSLIVTSNSTLVITEDTETIIVDSPYKIMLSVVPVIIIATVLVTMAAIIFRNRE